MIQIRNVQYRPHEEARTFFVIVIRLAALQEQQVQAEKKLRLTGIK